MILKTVYFTGYADDNNSCRCNTIFRRGCKSLFTWFFNNQMKPKPGKCQLLVNTKKQTTLKIDNLHIAKSVCEKLLGKLNFAKHIEDIYQKTSRKLNSLVKLALYMASSKTHSNECFLQVAI